MKDKAIKKVLLIGSGPIIIGQAAEFDYAGTQSLRILKEEGVQVVLINSNPATIMTDKKMADKTYIEPLTIPIIKRIIKKEKPDSILSGFGGQTGLNLSMQLAKSGFLKEQGVRLLGCNLETIEMAEDRLLFKEAMEEIGQPCVPSGIAHNLEEAKIEAEKIGYPIIVRPAFTLGGSGGGFASNEEELERTVRKGLSYSPISQVLIERSIVGWKEIEFEVLRDKVGNKVTVCSMENFDPVGVHTGDSIVIAPTVTLADKEFQMLRKASLDIVEKLGVEGGCNCQFALKPDSFEYAVIEVNPRVSRSSALASKATGYPIAKVATRIALGYTLDEIKNDVTGTTSASFEPSLDYVAVKFPKWAFDKFVYADKSLGTQMMATGEVMAIADTFEHALMKAVRGAEIGKESLYTTLYNNFSEELLLEYIKKPTDERIFAIYELIRRGVHIDAIYNRTKIDKWFLSKLKILADYDNQQENAEYKRGKRLGFTDRVLSKIMKKNTEDKIYPVYKMVDTCSGEFEASTPYYYSIHGENFENEAVDKGKKKKEKIVVLGSGPIRIGQGIEFDYACVQCVWALREMGYEVIVINNNPETVSTDFDIADKLYFEALHFEDVMAIIKNEKPIGVIPTFGGGTAIKLTGKLKEAGVSIIGTSPEAIDICEDRELFDNLLEELRILRPKGAAINNLEEALIAAKEIGYPVLMRPSYVLGGQNMIIAYNEQDVREYIEIIYRTEQENPVLIDKYISGLEIEVDAICDGENIFIPGIMEHIERTGVHSGDSIAMYPNMNLTEEQEEIVYMVTERICKELKVKGLVNIQYVASYEDGKIYVIEVNPRASRTVPYLAKVTGVDICALSTKAALGYKLSDLGLTTKYAKKPEIYAAKFPVFSFEKLANVDTQLGPEMKSTGEVLGIGKTPDEALYKGLVASGFKLKKEGSVFIAVRDIDKPEIAGIADKFHKLGFTIYATAGTAKVLGEAGIESITVDKIYEHTGNDARTLIESGKITCVISTSGKGRDPKRDSVKIRRLSCVRGIPTLTSIDTAKAVVDSMLSHWNEENVELISLDEIK